MKLFQFASWGAMAVAVVLSVAGCLSTLLPSPTLKQAAPLCILGAVLLLFLSLTSYALHLLLRRLADDRAHETRPQPGSSRNLSL